MGLFDRINEPYGANFGNPTPGGQPAPYAPPTPMASYTPVQTNYVQTPHMQMPGTQQNFGQMPTYNEAFNMSLAQNVYGTNNLFNNQG